METNKKHSKTPWAQRDFEVIGSYGSNKTICDCIGHESKYEENKANAAHIVECVNGYDTLLEENKRLKEALHTILNNFKANKNFGTTLNNQEIDAGISIMERTLNHSTVKEVGNNG